VGYAPADKPEIVVAALVQRGEHSAVAVPIVRDVIKAYFDKKLGNKPAEHPPETQAKVLSPLQPAGSPQAQRIQIARGMKIEEKKARARHLAGITKP